MYARTQGTKLSVSALGQKYAHFMYMGMSLADVQATLDVVTATKLSTAQTNVALDSARYYMYDFETVHTWRNNYISPVMLQVWALYPRRDLPSFVNANSAWTFTPPTTFNYVDCAVTNPSGWTDPLIDNATAVGTSVMTYADPNYTPFMNTVLTHCFKIRKAYIRVNGKRMHTAQLRPGEQASFMYKRRKPIMWSWNKLFMGKSGTKVGDEWECLRETPLLLMQTMGVVTHDHTTTTNVATGTAFLDYIVKAHARIVANQVVGQELYNPYGAIAAATADVVEEVTAAVVAE